MAWVPRAPITIDKNRVSPQRKKRKREEETKRERINEASG